MDSSLEVLPSSQSLSISARPTTRCGQSRKRGRMIEENMNTCCLPRSLCLPSPAANDFTPDDSIFPDYTCTPDSSHVFLVFPLFLLCLTLSFFQQEMYSSSRMFLSTRPTSTFDIGSNKFLTFGNPCFGYSSALCACVECMGKTYRR
jgi:hypothetical protein